MSSYTEVSAVAISAPKPIRHTTNFHPNIWGDQFLKETSEYKPIDPNIQKEYEQLKQEVRWMIMDTTVSHAQKLHLIDAVQRLGVAYLFVKEIEDSLDNISSDSNSDDYNDLCTVSIYFRLLRQHGIRISCDVFEKFKDCEGKFKSSLNDDIQGLLNLYEAAYLGIHGEDLLDEALAFTTVHLKSAVSCVSPRLAEQINHALNCPLRKGIPRLHARFYMSDVYPRDDSHNKTLLKFAKLDYNILQALHRKDLHDILQLVNEQKVIGWKEKLVLATKFPYARDRRVEEYFWILGILFEPQYSYGIKKFTQILSLLVIIDDTFDSYGTLEELTLFTEAIKRYLKASIPFEYLNRLRKSNSIMEIDAIDSLPDYMKHIYKAVLGEYAEIEEHMANQGKPCYISYAKERLQTLVQAYYDEAKWFNQGYVPTFEEYMTVALETSGVELFISLAYLGMDDATKEDLDWLWSNPKLVRGSKVIVRLVDDIVTHKFEQERGHVASAIECYMKQHGVSEEEAVKMMKVHVEKAWKDMNEDMLKPTSVSMNKLERVLNYACAIHVIYYKSGDSFNNPHKLKDKVALLLRDPVPL
ncbi:(-)-germacrene D synthase-like [Pistacia vera]|uniref:(-)-germacrene D synthase-like n=1 Tax=Pistacia vera TaxID=55513 RepID=UPI001263D420|nr:(-)-germacrene D synthase-like [Pistacia vera]